MTDPRSVVAEIYRQILLLRSQGKEPKRVYLHAKQFRSIVWYRQFLGTTDNQFPDYLGEYDIFGVPIYTSEVEDHISVE